MSRHNAFHQRLNEDAPVLFGDHDESECNPNRRGRRPSIEREYTTAEMQQAEDDANGPYDKP